MPLTITVIILIIVFSLFFYLTYKTLKFYHDYFSSHIGFTIEYFREKNLNVVDIKSPQHSEWILNPFNKNDLSIFNSIFSFPPMLILREHTIIYVSSENNDEIQIFWRQATSALFSKLEIKFLEQVNPPDDFLSSQLINKVIKVKDYCPACGNKIEPTHLACLECGLFFE